MKDTHGLSVNQLQSLIAGAGQLAYEERRKPFDISRKPDGTLVTSVDLAVDVYYHEALGKAFPGDAVRSEERPDPPGLRDAQTVWLVDPIDGTTLLTRSEPEYSTLVGLWKAGKMLAGAACFPELQLSMVSVRGEGVFINGRAVKMSNRGSEVSHRVMTIGKRFKPLKTVGGTVRSPALEMLRLIGGEYEGLVAALPAACGEHDYAWAVCAIEEAGGVITDGEGQPLRFNKPDRGMPPLLVAGSVEGHKRLFEAVEKLLA